MGAVASVAKALSCDTCAKYVCNSLTARSQCCDNDDACNCIIETHETALSADSQEIDVSLPWLNIHAAT